METKKKQDYKKLLGYIKHNDLEHETFNKIRFSNEEYEVAVSDDTFNEGFYYISIYEKKTKTIIVIAATKTMEEVLELIDANVFGVKMIAPTADVNPNQHLIETH
jgi:hypothetical protein